MIYLGDSQAGLLWDLLNSFENFNSILDLPGLVWGLIVLVWNMFWFDYAFFQGGWIIMRYLFWSVSIGLIWSMVLAVRGVSSA